jgi:hypothetical protein
MDASVKHFYFDGTYQLNSIIIPKKKSENFFPKKSPKLCLSEVETFLPEIIGNLFSNKKAKKNSKKKSKTFFVE